MMRFVRSEGGSVSVYLIIVTAAVFAFIAVFIDYARMAAASRQTESILQAASRSVLSAYERELQARYGLFGVGRSSGEAIYANVLENSLVHDADGTIRLLDTRFDRQSLQLERELGRYDVFKRQMLEEMKYKAPIDFTIELVQRLKPMSKVMKQASTAAKTLESMRKLYEQREKSLSRALTLQKKVRDAVLNARFDTMISASGSPQLDDRPLGGISAADDAAAQNSAYAQALQQLEQMQNANPSSAAKPPGSVQNDKENKEEDHRSQLQKSVEAYRSGVRANAAEMGEAAGSVLDKHTQWLKEAEEEIAEAQETNERMKQVVAESKRQTANSGYDRVAESETSSSPVEDAETKAALEAIGDANASAEKLLMADSYFSEYKREIGEQASAFARYAQASAQYGSAASAGLSGTGGSGAMKSAVTEMYSQWKTYRSQYGNEGGVIVAREAGASERTRGDAERKAKEAQANAKLGEAKSLLDRLKSLAGGENAEAFNTVTRYFEDNVRFNEQSVQADSSAGNTDWSNAHESEASSMSMMDMLFSGMAEILEQLRDELYTNEYAAGNFTSFDPTKLKSLLKGGSDASLQEALKLSNQELEYIIYGLNSVTGNIASAYGEIFLIRLAIRTMEGFSEAKSLGHPLLILVGALLYGIEKSLEDMNDLVQNGELTLSKYVKVKLTYKDHLRLFMLIHGNGERMMSRMLALIRHSTGKDPATLYTYAVGTGEASVRVWFLPGVVGLLNGLNPAAGGVSGNRYRTERTAAFAY